MSVPDGHHRERSEPIRDQSSTETDELDAMLAEIAGAVEDARAYQHTHGLTTTATRKLPGVLLRTLERWRQRMRENTAAR